MSGGRAGFLNLTELKISSNDGALPAPMPTPLLYDRRGPERRALGRVPEAIERKVNRRGEERRTSPRVPRRLWILDRVEGGVPKVYEGELGLGGASWHTEYPPLADQLEVRFRVPECDEEVRATGKIARVARVGEDTQVQVVFTDLPLRHELALARYLDGCTTAS